MNGWLVSAIVVVVVLVGSSLLLTNMLDRLANRWAAEDAGDCGMALILDDESDDDDDPDAWGPYPAAGQWRELTDADLAGDALDDAEPAVHDPDPRVPYGTGSGLVHPYCRLHRDEACEWCADVMLGRPKRITTT